MSPSVVSNTKPPGTDSHIFTKLNSGVNSVSEDSGGSWGRTKDISRPTDLSPLHGGRDIEKAGGSDKSNSGNGGTNANQRISLTQGGLRQRVYRLKMTENQLMTILQTKMREVPLYE